MDPTQLIQDGTTFASKAVANDKQNNHKLAHFFYMEAAEAILKALTLDRSLDPLKVKVAQYIERAEVLQAIIGFYITYYLLFFFYS